MSSPTAAAVDAAAAPLSNGDMTSAASTAAAVAAVVVVADVISSDSSAAEGAATALLPTSKAHDTQQQQHMQGLQEQRPLSIGTPLEEIPLDTTFSGPALGAIAPHHAPLDAVLSSSSSAAAAAASAPPVALKLDVSTASTFPSAAAGAEEQGSSTPSSAARRSHSMKSDGLSASSSVSRGTGTGSQREDAGGSSSTSAAHSDGLGRAPSGKSTAGEVEQGAGSGAEARPALTGERGLSIHTAAQSVAPGEAQLVTVEAVHADDQQAAASVFVIPPTPSSSKAPAQASCTPLYAVPSADSHARNASVSSASGSGGSHSGSNTTRRRPPLLPELRTSNGDLERRNAKPLPPPGPSTPSPTSPMLPEYLLGLYSAEALAASEMALSGTPFLSPHDAERRQLGLPNAAPSNGINDTMRSSSVEALSVPARTASMSGSASSSADSIRSSSAATRERPSLKAAFHRSSRYFLGGASSSKNAQSSAASNEAGSSAQSSPRTDEVPGSVVGTGSSSRLRPPDAGEAAAMQDHSAHSSPRSAKISPPLPAAPRSHSPFLFRRKSKIALVLADEGAEEVVSAARARKDSSKTNGSKGSRGATPAASPTAASFARVDPPPNRSTRSRFSQRFSLNDPAWSRGSSAAATAAAAAGGRAVSPPSSIRANVGVERMDGLVSSQQRPLLLRTRSKSMDAMRKVYLDAGARAELGVEALSIVTADAELNARVQASPSSATPSGGSLLLRAEMIEAATPSPLLTPSEASPSGRSVDLPAVDEPLSRPPSRWSQALSRKRASTQPPKPASKLSNVAQGKVSSSNSAPKGLSKRAEGAREGALSRLTGSVRNRTSTGVKASGLTAKSRASSKAAATASVTSLNSTVPPESSGYEASSSSTLQPSNESNTWTGELNAWPAAAEGGLSSVGTSESTELGAAWWGSEYTADTLRSSDLVDLHVAAAAAAGMTDGDDAASIEALFEDAFSTAQHSSTTSSPRLLKLQPVRVSTDVDQSVPYKSSSSRGHARTRSSGFTRLANALSRSRPPSPNERRASTSMGFNAPLSSSSNGAKARTTNAAAAHLEHSRNNSNATGAGGHSRNASVAGSESSFITSLTHASVARSVADIASSTSGAAGTSASATTPLKRLAMGRSTLTDPTIASAARARKPYVAASAVVASPAASPASARRQLANAQPPSSYRASGSPARVAALSNAASTRTPPSPAARNPNPPSTTITRKSAAQRARGSTDTSMSRTRTVSMGSTAVSDTEEDPLPPPRSSSRQALYSASRASDELNPSTPSPARRGAAARRPSLSIETDANAAVSVLIASPKELAPRPATSLEFTPRGGLASPTAPPRASMTKRKASQPMTLSIADDGEFLAALEDVRAQHQARIKAKEEQGRRVERMAKLGMSSATHAAQTRKDNAGATNAGGGDKSGSPTTTTATSRGRARSASLEMESYEADEIRRIMRNGPLLSTSTAAGSDDASDPSLREASEETSVPTPLERGVGKASGRLKDGAFVNDEDWKNEVSALFVTRELVQTERSYARHLESLVQAIRRMPSSTASATHASLQRRSSSGMLLSNASPSPKPSAVPAPHLVLMKNLLPRLIELSRTLAQHIDANPTAAGVGAAFQLVAPQLESAFVNWSSVAGDVMDALRVAEGPKGKAKDKIGLVPLLPLDVDILQATVAQDGVSAATASPARPRDKRRSTALEALSLTRPSSPVQGYRPSLPPLELPVLQKTSPMMIAFDLPAAPLSADSDVKSASRRRNTFSSSTLGPPVVAPASASADLASNRTASSTWNFSTQRRQATRVPPLPNGTVVPPSPTSARDAGPTSSLPRTIPKTKALAPADILIQPTQRIPRYLLLLRELQQSTPPQSLSYLRIQRALEMLRRVATLVNAATKSSSPVTSRQGSMLASWKPMAR